MPNPHGRTRPTLSSLSTVQRPAIVGGSTEGHRWEARCLFALFGAASTMQLPPWLATTAGGHHGRLIWVAIGSCEMPAVARRRTHRLLDVKQSLSCCGAASVTIPQTHDGQVHLDKPRRRGCVPRPPPEAALEAGVGKCLAPMALGWAWLAGRGSPYPRKTESRLQTDCFVRGKGFCRQVSAPPLPTCVDAQLCWSWRSPKAPTGADPACSEAQVGDGPEWWNRMRQWHLQVVTTRAWASQPASGEAPGLSLALQAPGAGPGAWVVGGIVGIQSRGSVTQDGVSTGSCRDQKEPSRGSLEDLLSCHGEIHKGLDLRRYSRTGRVGFAWNGPRSSNDFWQSRLSNFEASGDPRRHGYRGSTDRRRDETQVARPRTWGGFKQRDLRSRLPGVFSLSRGFLQFPFPQLLTHVPELPAALPRPRHTRHDTTGPGTASSCLLC